MRTDVPRGEGRKTAGIVARPTQKETLAQVNARVFFGTPKGIRTPVAGLKGLCPRPLDDEGILATIRMSIAAGMRMVKFSPG